MMSAIVGDLRAALRGGPYIFRLSPVDETSDDLDYGNHPPGLINDIPAVGRLA